MVRQRRLLRAWDIPEPLAFKVSGNLAARSQIALKDPIDMEHVLQNDPTLGKQLLAQRLETQAEVSRVVADASAKAAKLLK